MKKTNGLVLGQFEDGTLYIDHESPHIITLAPTGKGKGQNHAIPNLWEYNGGVFVLDVKGENYEETKTQREEITPNRVFKFDATDPHNSAKYNPLDFIPRNDLDRWEACDQLANLLITPKAGSYFDESGRDLVTAILEYVVLKNEGRGEPANMREVCRVLSQMAKDKLAAKEQREVEASVFEDMIAGGELSAQMEQTAVTYQAMSYNQFSGVHGTADTALRMWKSPRVQILTDSTSKGWEPSTFKINPASVFICIPPMQMKQYSSVLRVLVGQHVEALMQVEFNKEHENHFLFMLDEFPLLHYLECLDAAHNVGRSYGVKLWLLAQNYGQIKQHWPNPEGILSACETRVFMNVNDMETARYIEQMVPRTKAGIGNKKEKPWVTTSELMGETWKDAVLVLRDNQNPARLLKRPAYELKKQGLY